MGHLATHLKPELPSRAARGFALFTALVFLALTLVLALAASRSGQLMHTVAANERAKSLADAAAEAALRRGEHLLLVQYLVSNGTVLAGDLQGSQGIYSPDAVLSSTALQNFMIPDRWPGTGDGSIPGAQMVANSEIDFQGASEALKYQPGFIIEDLGPARPGGGTSGELGATGGTGYEGSAGGSPAGNSDLRVYRITSKSTGPTTRAITTMQSVFAGRTQG
ncbi:MAG TPA: hypothetical protein VFA81_04620 [Burkholderiales bacterium]|jgi:Tfp pilus assembly protein PilX|nr:hypothetical protein [Burkholderiales bacterium]